MISALPLQDLMPLVETIAFPQVSQGKIVSPGMPVGLIGKPGSGKTSFIEDIAARKGYRLEVLPLSTWTAESINGIPAKEVRKIPDRNGELVDFALCVDVAPDWQFRIFAEHDRAGRRIPTLLFLDEASNVEPAVMATLLTLVQSRRLPNNMRLPDDTVIILAMNSQDDSVNGFPTPPPMQNRVAWFAWEVSPTTWVEGFRRNWGHPIPSREEEYWRNIIGDYIADNPSELEVPSNGGVDNAVGRSKAEIKEATAYAWQSGRSWDNLARQFAKFGRGQHLVLGRVATAIIGVTGAQRFMGYYREKAATVTVTDLLDDPNTVIDHIHDVNLLTRLTDGVIAKINAERTPQIAEATIHLYQSAGEQEQLAGLRVQLGSRITSVVDALHGFPDGNRWVSRLMPVLKQYYGGIMGNMG